jgi:hypothetical protein
MSERDRRRGGGSRDGGGRADDTREIGGLMQLLNDPRTRGAVMLKIQARRERIRGELAAQAAAKEAAKNKARAAEATKQGEYGPAVVELCKAPTEFMGGAGPVQKTLGKMGLAHWWIKTPDFEAGMGPAGGGVPGVPGAPAGPMMTTINDHTGRHAAPVSECHPASQPGWGDPRWEREDKACLQAHMQLGQETGPWIPPINDCHDVVKAALNECAVSHELEGGGVLPEPTDMGAPTDGRTP